MTLCVSVSTTLDFVLTVCDTDVDAARDVTDSTTLSPPGLFSLVNGKSGKLLRKKVGNWLYLPSFYETPSRKHGWQGLSIGPQVAGTFRISGKVQGKVQGVVQGTVPGMPA